MRGRVRALVLFLLEPCGSRACKGGKIPLYKMTGLNSIKKILAGTLIFAFLASAVFTAPSFAEGEWPSGVSVSAEGACVMDADSGTILYGKNADIAYYPASITKVMTALLTIENCPDLDEIVTFSREAVELGEDNATIIGASAGDRLSVRDCLYSLLFKSANEVANALAEHVGAKFPDRKKSGMSNRDVFVEMMNEKAASLGCTNTHFDNPSGLTDSEHYTTAHDMCLILAEAIKNPTFLEIEGRTYWTHGPIKRYPDPNDPWNTVYQSHRMLRKNSYYYYPGVFAGKTGFTTTAGNTLVTACKKDGMTLVVTVLNGHMTHYEDTKRLLDFGYQNFHTLKVAEYDTSFRSVRQDLSVGGIAISDMAAPEVDEDSSITLPMGQEFDAVQSEMRFDMTKDDPEDAVAKIQYSYGGRPIGSAYLRERIAGQTDLIAAAEEDPLYQTLAKSAAPDQLEGGTGSHEQNQEQNNAGDGTGDSGTSAAGQDGPGNGAESGTDASSSEGRSFLSLRISPRVSLVLKIVGAAAVLLLIGALLLLRREKREAQQRAKRRSQRLKHTRDLTGSQNIKLDLMVQQSLQKKKSRKRKTHRGSKRNGIL